MTPPTPTSARTGNGKGRESGPFHVTTQARVFARTHEGTPPACVGLAPLKTALLRVLLTKVASLAFARVMTTPVRFAPWKLSGTSSRRSDLGRAKVDRGDAAAGLGRRGPPFDPLQPPASGWTDDAKPGRKSGPGALGAGLWPWRTRLCAREAFFVRPMSPPGETALQRAGSLSRKQGGGGWTFTVQN